MDKVNSNFTILPNDIRDYIAVHRPPKRVTSIILFVLGKTKGWQKEWDEISFSQFSEALNINERTVWSLVKDMEKCNMLCSRKEGNAYIYKVNEDGFQWRCGDSGDGSISTGDGNSRDVENDYHSCESTTLQTPRVATQETPTKDSIKETNNELKKNICIGDKGVQEDTPYEPEVSKEEKENIARLTFNIFPVETDEARARGDLANTILTEDEIEEAINAEKERIHAHNNTCTSNTEVLCN